MTEPNNGEEEPTIGLLKFADDEANFYTGKASEITRTLSITCIAAVWLFSTDPSHKSPWDALHSIDANQLLRASLSCAIGALACDFLQYIVGAFLATLSRWALSVAFERDNYPEPLTIVERVGWLIGRAVGVPSMISEYGNVDIEDLDWESTRDRLRSAIDSWRQESSLPKGIRVERGYSLLTIGPNVLFWLKSALLIAAYGTLALDVVRA